MHLAACRDNLVCSWEEGQQNKDIQIQIDVNKREFGPKDTYREKLSSKQD